MKVDIAKITELFEQDKLEEAKDALEDYLSEIELTEVERGEIYANLASMYLQVQNRLSKQYLESLRNMRASLEDLSRKKKKALERIDIEAAKRSVREHDA